MNESLRMRAAKALMWIAGLGLPALAHAQDAALDPADSGDTAWLLAATLLGLLLVLPGLALFHAGRARAQSLASVMTQTAAVVALVSVLWIVVGYTLAFGTVSNGWLGSGNAWMLIDLGNVRQDTLVPESAYALFEMVFALVAPALLVGAWVDRARFGWVIGFAALWSLIVYAPIAHWVWGGGWLATRLGTVDYAGGLVVHVSAGVSALVVALLLGRRERFATALASTGSSPLLTITGAALVWAGSLALAGGSAFAAGDDAAMALVNTHVAAAVAALAWLLLDRLKGAKPGPTGLARGVVAGLAIVAPAAAYISPGMAVVLGILGAVLAKGAARVVQGHLQIDDSLGVFAGHGVTGAAGTVLTALVLNPAFGGTGYGPGMDLAHQVMGQVVGVVTVAAWSAIATAIAALMVSMALPMRVTREDELAGLDKTSHGEDAYQPD
ncbi:MULTISPECIES: ammonium transporter [unclassified Novosphingobium]|uniref:ammonium transporter n=1 Tax=unclassified Novosphingobium TaxID=2644732 RepID=UPI0017B6B16A|nr:MULTISPECIES: ammonium transporter [unclassified Novosphingobium]NMN03689.1 Amt family ammonium transporter [Novosphingobium sp. SG919]NMN86321.1 Amt family ammonium transporter [Novosphingobium sp. SG916]